MARGTHITLQQLVALRLCAAQLQLFSANPSRTLLAGNVRSRFRGRGLDFAEVRSYQPGDEIRAIDWRVTARTGTAHTKLYTEDRERPVLIVLDQSHNMRFGTRRYFKSVQAAESAALLAWSALRHNDRVGGLVFSEKDQLDIRPKRSRKTVLSLLSAIAEIRQQSSDVDTSAPPHSINSILTELRRLAKPGTAIFLLSDFAQLDDSGQKQLHLLKRHNDVHALNFFDPMEYQLPLSGRRTYTDGRQRLTIDDGDTSLQQAFRQQFEHRQQQLQHLFLGSGIPCVNISTTDDALQRLLRHYSPASQKSGKRTAERNPTAKQRSVLR